MAKKKPKAEISPRESHKPPPRKVSVGVFNNTTGGTGPIRLEAQMGAGLQLLTAPGAYTPQFPIVGVGASAGGLEALEYLFQIMPADGGIAFVVVTHQHPAHTSMLPELLQKSTNLPVAEATHGTKVEPNHIYVGPPGGHLAIVNGHLERIERSSEKAPHLPIDFFLRSLAMDQKDLAICIILSGTGTDGTLGLKAVKGESGMAMVESPSSAKYAGMPASAIATGMADYVLPPAEMSTHLLSYAQALRRGERLQIAEGTAAAPAPIDRILALLRTHTGNDFSNYKANTLMRRMERRMNVHQISKTTQYARFLQENPQEIDILFKELLISVTNYFRDPAAWQMLEEGPLLDLLKTLPEGYTFRAWVPGCATGEEAYTLAIVLRECIEKLGRNITVQIFATDLDLVAVESARQGKYPDGIAADISPERLERYFTRRDNTYTVRKEIREMVVFAPQNLIKDPPFTKLDMISCRNLLIYLNAELQKRLLPIFYFSLRPGGLLFLGPSESIGIAALDQFQPLDKRWKLFRRKEMVGPRPLPEISLFSEPTRVAHESEGLSAKKAQISMLVERLLVNQFAPVSVVVNDRGDIIYIHGRTGKFLEPVEGQPRLNVLEMAREGLRIDLAAALRQASTQPQPVLRQHVRVKTNGGFEQVTVSVNRIHEPEAIRGLLLVTFREEPPPPPEATRKARGKKTPGDDRVGELELELQYAKESLKTTVEELETSNEELKSTNEELQSTNEELQSTNEELETSKEEMQSLNEELSTVNAELQSKVDDLSQANDDMRNLLNSTDIATIFLDNNLNIKRFTEQATEVISLRPSDIGRPVIELASNLQHERLLDDCRSVLKTLVFKETTVRTHAGRWYLMRIMPYRTTENLIDGLVLTFVDIDRLREAQRNLRRMSRVFMLAGECKFILDREGNILHFNESVQQTYGYTREELLDHSIAKLAAPAERVHAQQLVQKLVEQCRDGASLRDVPLTQITRDHKELPVLATLNLLADEEGHPDAIVLTVRPAASR